MIPSPQLSLNKVLNFGTIHGAGYHQIPKTDNLNRVIPWQALSELEKPLVPEIEDLMAARQPIVSKYVYDEFCSIVSLVGGPKENDRARVLLQRIRYFVKELYCSESLRCFLNIF